jgi:hypothetical protein
LYWLQAKFDSLLFKLGYCHSDVIYDKSKWSFMRIETPPNLISIPLNALELCLMYLIIKHEECKRT